MKPSIVGFKVSSSDLRKRSPWILLISLIVSIAITAVFITRPFIRVDSEREIPVAPVVVHLQHIPETIQRVRLPAPPRPLITSGAPLGVDEFLPDDVTIEDTNLEIDAAPELPPALLVSDTGAAEVEKELFEVYEVEEIPKRLENVVPNYPELAKRAGIEGTVTVKLLVNSTGVVDSVRVIDGPAIFHDSVVEAAKATKYSPAKYNDVDVSCWVLTSFRFEFKQ